MLAKAPLPWKKNESPVTFKVDTTAKPSLKLILMLESIMSITDWQIKQTLTL